jgi:dCTP deaminase
MEAPKGMWSGETLAANLNELVPESCDGTRVDKVAIELCLGREVFISGNAIKKFAGPGEQISIPSGQMALLLTEEKIRIPRNAMGFISMKSGVKLHGLVNISGFHVDPGFEGHLVFSVSNSGPSSVPLTREEPLFMLFLCSLDQPTQRVYDGTRRNLNSIKDEMVRGLQGSFPSPQLLQDQIRTIRDNVTDEVARLHSRVTRIRWWAGTIGLILGVVLSGVGIAIWTVISALINKK